MLDKPLIEYMRDKIIMSDKKYPLNITQLSELLDINRNKLKRILEEHGFEYEMGNRGAHLYDLISVARNSLQLLQNKPQLHESKVDEGMDDKARLTRYKADLEGFKVAEKQNTMVDTTVVLAAVRSEYQLVREQLITIPQSMAVKLSVTSNPEKVQELLTNKINNILMSLQQDQKEESHDIQTEVNGGEE